MPVAPPRVAAIPAGTGRPGSRAGLRLALHTHWGHFGSFPTTQLRMALTRAPQWRALSARSRAPSRPEGALAQGASALAEEVLPGWQQRCATLTTGRLPRSVLACAWLAIRAGSNGAHSPPLLLCHPLLFVRYHSLTPSRSQRLLRRQRVRRLRGLRHRRRPSVHRRWCVPADGQILALLLQEPQASSSRMSELMP